MRIWKGPWQQHRNLRDELGQLRLVLGADLGEGDHSSGLFVDNSAQSSLVLDNDVGDAHLAAEGGDEDNELNGVNVVSEDHEAGLLGSALREAKDMR